MIIYYLKNIFESLKFNLFRTFLTGIGILIGISSVVVIFTISDSFSESLKKDLTGDSIIIGLTSSILENDDFNSILELPKVQESINAVHSIKNVKSFKQDEPEELISYYYLGEMQESVEFEFNNDVIVDEGKNFDSVTGNVVIIRNSNEFDSKYKIGNSICVNGVMYTIVGFTSQSGEDSMPVLFFPKWLENDIVISDYESSSTFELQVDGNDNSTVNKVINKLNENLPTGYKFMNFTAEMDSSISEALSSISIFVGLIAMISLVVAAINVANIMYISILERKGEVAIYRALGMKKSEVKFIFLLEAIIIVLAFSILGYLVGISLAYIILTVLRIEIIINFKNILGVILLSMITGIISGYRPAKIASKTNTADILK